jgi:putative NIF3 family GTP cyclohydrolase 1 type 2
MSFKKLYKIVKSKLGLDIMKSVKSHNHINTISLTTGSGMSLLSSITSDCFLTGDIKYHEAMEAKAKGITLLDIGHYESEIYFTRLLNTLIKDYLINNDKEAIILSSNNPFKYV